jgi:putative restriction endonuclease
MNQKTLIRFTDLSEASSRDDWSRILSRKLPPKGTRQERFTPTEVVLCLAAMEVVDHRRFGGSTSHLAPLPVQHLARVFRRPPTSILAKMANLDGSRSHSGKAEPEAAVILRASGGAGLRRVYENALRAARAAGITEDELPAFLDSRA